MIKKQNNSTFIIFSNIQYQFVCLVSNTQTLHLDLMLLKTTVTIYKKLSLSKTTNIKKIIIIWPLYLVFKSL